MIAVAEHVNGKALPARVGWTRQYVGRLRGRGPQAAATKPQLEAIAVGS